MRTNDNTHAHPSYAHNKTSIVRTSVCQRSVLTEVFLDIMPCSLSSGLKAKAWKKRFSTMKIEAVRSSESGPEELSRYSDSLRAGRSGDQIPGEARFFRTRPDQPWGPPSLLYNGYRVSFPGVKRPGRGVDHPTPSSAEVKESVELYLYSPSGPSWPVRG